MKKYNTELEKYKKIYFPPYTVLKAYIISIIMSLLIVAIILLPLFNLILLSHYFKIILGIGLFTALLCSYLILYFKDKILLMYSEEMKNVNLLYIRLYDTIVVSIFILVFYIAYIIIC